MDISVCEFQPIEIKYRGLIANQRRLRGYFSREFQPIEIKHVGLLANQKTQRCRAIHFEALFNLPSHE